MQTGELTQRGFHMSLQEIDDGYWRYGNHNFGGAPAFDFRVESADGSLLESQCEWLPTHPDSVFVQVLIAQQFNEQGYDIQRGPVAKTIQATGVEQKELSSADEFEDRLGAVFGIEDSELKDLWPKTVEAFERFKASHN